MAMQSISTLMSSEFNLIQALLRKDELLQAQSAELQSFREKQKYQQPIADVLQMIMEVEEFNKKMEMKVEEFNKKMEMKVEEVKKKCEEMMNELETHKEQIIELHRVQRFG